jgi:surface antigen
MKGAHYRVGTMSRLHFATFVFGLCLFGLGIGILSAGVDVSRVSLTTSTTTVPTTNLVSPITVAPVEIPRPPAKKPPLLPVHPQETRVLTPTTQIGTDLSIAREPSTTTTHVPKTPLEIAQGEVGKTGPYAEGGFWCAKFASFVAEKAEVPQFEASDSPARLYAVAKEQGRLTDTPQPGYLVFIDLTGENFANQYVSHVGIVESVDGDTFISIEGNADNSGLVTRQTHTVGDGYVIAFAPFSA